MPGNVLDESRFPKSFLKQRLFFSPYTIRVYFALKSALTREDQSRTGKSKGTGSADRVSRSI